jgi:hypothetical protein
MKIEEENRWLFGLLMLAIATLVMSVMADDFVTRIKDAELRQLRQAVQQYQEGR